MEFLRVKNFRSIADSGEIEFKPITVFLGKNSCGKSSFIRLLPLIKQSLERNRQEPLLWYGEYVDFGDFKNILPYGQNKKSFELSFELFFASDLYNNRIFFDDRLLNLNRAKKTTPVFVELKFQEKNISDVCVKFFDQELKCHMDISQSNAKVYINGKELPSIFKFSVINTRNLIPALRFDFQEYGVRGVKSVLAKDLEAFAKENIPNANRIKDYDFLYGEPSHLFQSREKLLKHLQKLDKKTISEFFLNRGIDDEVFNEINARLVLWNVPEIIDAINNVLRKEFDAVKYVKPLRANANRYYRVQGISVENVDSDGSNVPMILYNLKEPEKRAFAEWCKINLGAEFSVETHEGHVSLTLKTLDNNTVNLADAGYGYSQVLPIILQLWLLISKKKTPASVFHYGYDVNSDCVLIVEQPELHLHPAFQAKLMDLFVSLISEMQQKGRRIRIVFETHSETMINRLGALVASGRIRQEDVNVVLVEKQENASKFKQVQFNEDGYIKDWPIGFMSPED